jgi:hypothetical protein
MVDKRCNFILCWNSEGLHGTQTELFVFKMQVEDAVLNHLTPPAYAEVASGLQIQGIIRNGYILDTNMQQMIQITVLHTFRLSKKNAMETL